jgi:filamentous hemagglutinin family protein
MLVLFLITPSVGDAQVVTTNITQTTGAGNLGTQVLPPSGNVYGITGGKTLGTNLFHSFGEFSVGAGDIAQFQTSNLIANPSMSNILGRVTGGNPSNIFGAIDSATFYPGANLFLMNPFGIVFGPNASLNVGGSVSFTNAQYIRLFDGLSSANFYADPAHDGLANSILTIDSSAFTFLNASPAAYGFLTAPGPNATITVQGSALSVPSGQSISLVGGNISIGADPSTGTPAVLSAPGGQINLASVASDGEVSAANFMPTSGMTMGNISLSQGTTLDVSGSENVGSGVVVIRGGQLMIDQSSIIANTVDGNGSNPGIDIQVSQDLSLTNGAIIASSTSGAGRGGDVAIVAGTVQMDGASITSASTGSGRGGNISITDAQTVNLTNGAQIVTSTAGTGAGGDIMISATDTVSISGVDGTGTLSGVVNPFVGIVTSGVFSTASAGGHGGQISIRAPNVTLDNEGTIATFNSGVGNGGGISINSTTVTVGLTSEAFILSLTGLDLTTLEPVDSGTGGNVTIQGLSGAADSAANLVTLSSGAQITSITGGPSSGGDILITSGDVQLDGASINSGFTGVGDGGNITVNVGTLSLTNSAAIKSLNESVRLGQGGNITVQGLSGAADDPATSVTLSSSGNITSETSAPDPGGAILIISKAVQLDTEASINSSTSGNGAGGNITAKVDKLELMNGASITSKTSSLESRPPDSPDFAKGGNITVQGLPGVTDNPATSVTLTTGSRIATETFGSGDGGQVAITSESLKMDNSIIATATSQTGDGGDIVVSVSEARLSGGATIKSNTVLDAAPDATPAGHGGTVTVQGLDGDKSKADIFSASDKSGMISTAFGSGRLGNIEVFAKTVSLTDVSLIQAGTQQDTGKTAGDVFIDADSVSISGGSSIRSQVFFADAGKVTITADQLTLNNGTIEVSTHGIGDGGNVVLNVGSMSLANGATISSSSSGMDVGAGNAGNVTINASGPFTSSASTIATSAENAKGGDILINAQNVQLSNGSLISASSNAPFTQVGEGNAGNIKITSDSNFIMQNSSMTTEAAHTSGGTIEIKAPEMVQLINSNIKTSVKGTQGDTAGGDITIDPQFVILQGSEILAQANVGTGGNITITSNVFLADPTSVVDASSQLGVSGVVDIRSPVSNISGIIGRLPESVLAAQALLRAACAARLAESQVSSFVERGRDSIPIGPDGLLATPYLPPSSEPSSQMGSVPVDSGREPKGESFRTSGVQVRRLIGADSIPRVQLLSDDIACGS